MEDIFAKFGRVTEARLAVDKFSGRPKGFAFVTMDDARDAADAARELVGFEISGRTIRVEISHGLGSGRRRDDRGGGGGYGRDRRDYGRDRGYDRGYDRRDRSRDRGYDRGDRDRDRGRDRSPDRRDRSRDRYERRRSRSNSRGRR